MKYAKIEQSTGKLLGFSPDEEEGLIEITDDVWQEALKIEYNFCYYKDGKFVYKDTRTLDEIKVQEYNKQIQEAKQYLASTDFYMTVDKYATLTVEKQVELTTKRTEARELINTLEAELITLQGAK